MIQLASSHPAAVDSSEYLSSAPLDICQLLSLAHDPKAGAVVLFSGEVRETNLGKEVDHLEYEAQLSMASKMMRTILDEAIARWSLQFAIARHRVGKVQIGESAVVVITSSRHRKEAYEANQFIISKIKHEVPIWKCEYFADGSREWVGECAC